MCTYHGILEEYPLISIDSFESYNYTSTMFFITHIHLDHLVGLERPEFGRYVAKINAPIYMSDISKQLLSTMPIYRHLVPYFKSVPIDQPFTLTIRSNDPVQAKKKDGADNESLKNTLAFHTPNVGETVVVTCFGSGHCPGSIMIWIEGAHGNVLFTGDFRLYHGQSKRLTHLHRRRTDNDDNYIFKPIDNLYIDMTFFRPEILHIPTREVSCEALILWIKSRLKEESNVHFHFKQSARVGYEQIYRTLYENLNMRVHVEQSQYEFFTCLPIIQECLTTDPTVTRLHACRSAASNYTEPCSLFRTCDKPIRIFLSIMWFTEQVAASELLVEYHEYHSNFNQNLTNRCLGFQDYESVTTYPDKYLGYRLCYSLHSSFSEIVDVLKTLTPKRVTPIASPLISLMPTKRLFQTIDHLLRDRTKEQSGEAIPKKIANTQIQLKHRYESFETKLERKRRRKLFKEQQQRRANDEELDLGLNDEMEETLLQRIHSLNRSLAEQNKALPSQQSYQSLSLEIESDRVTIITCEEESSSVSDHQPMELIYTKIHRERTMSEASSDTVDYNFERETYVALKFDSQQSSPSLPIVD
ncbi:unnamed protein product [Adineta ricciae]|uniref:Protein artemis n=1 Tax=Adineta ricciae TaxID=249248 RepID=A0A814WF67_ADIRI|nr:unnamed protein product [Adineta ricciae]